MPILNIPVDPERPIIDISVGVSVARQRGLLSRGQPVPAPIVIRALVDCGATRTNIVPAVVQALGLVSRGSVPVTTPSTGPTVVMFDEYDVSLTILHPDIAKIFSNARILECQPLSSYYDALLGRDVLDHCLFFYNGPAQTFSLAY